MARSIAQIQALMIADIQSTPALSGLTSTSKRAIWLAWTFVIATAISLLENLIDVFTASVETIASSAAAASTSWLKNQLLLFQYDPITPQIVQLINFAPAYPIVDATKQIISRVSVITTVAGQTIIKVATGNPPGALNSDQLSAAQDYVNTIGATINYVVSSQAADQLYINADVYFAGQYSAIIQQTVINAINTLLSTFSSVNFNGALRLSDIEEAIRAVPGVNDAVLKNVIGRAAATPFSGGTYLLQNQQLINRTFSPVSGYVISETTTNETLTDSLNFIAE